MDVPSRLLTGAVTGAIAMVAVGFLLQGKAEKLKLTGPNPSFVAAVKTAPPSNPWQIAGRGHRHRPIYQIEAGDSRRRGAHRGSLFALIKGPWRRSFEKRQADCDSGDGHLLTTIKPKIVCNTIILSTNNLFLLTPPTSPSGRVAKPVAIDFSIRSSRSLPSAFRVILTRSMHSLMILQHDR